MHVRVPSAAVRLLRALRPTPGLEPLLPGLAALAGVALLCNVALELAGVWGLGRPVTFENAGWGPLFWLNAAVLWAVLALVHAVVGRLAVTAAVAGFGTAAVVVADREKLQQLNEPLYPSDLFFLGQLDILTAMVGSGVLVGLVAAVLVVLLLAVAAVRLARWAVPPLRPRQVSRRRRLLELSGRAVTAGLSVALLVNLSHFNAPGNTSRDAYEALGAEWRHWNQQVNYLSNGFVGGFLYNLDVPPAPRPAGYSARTMARIVERYTEAADRINRDRSHDALDDVNVVIVLNETFSDPTQLNGVHVPNDPIPYIRQLMRTEMAGDALAQAVGTGTANMEFEALTGLSTALLPVQLRVPYQMLVPQKETFPSVVSWLEEAGHRPVALHSFEPYLYRRQEVYRVFGFDEFLYDDTMHATDRIGNNGYISDAATFDEVTRLMEESEDPLLLNVVTMQNHMPYRDRYDDRVRVEGPDGKALHPTGMYVRGLTYTDQAVADLLADLRRSEEDTVVAFYGDHLPNIYPDEIHRLNPGTGMRRLPMFVWASFPGPREPQPMSNPTHVMDMVLERADAAVPPYYALLQRLRAVVPAMDHLHFYDTEGRPVRPEDLPPEQAQVLRDYQLVQYDLAFGRRYSEEGMFGTTAQREVVQARERRG